MYWGCKEKDFEGLFFTFQIRFKFLLKTMVFGKNLENL